MGFNSGFKGLKVKVAVSQSSIICTHQICTKLLKLIPPFLPHYLQENISYYFKGIVVRLFKHFGVNIHTLLG